MFHDGWGFWGMHVFWWLLLIVAVFLLLTLLPRRKARATPLEVLQHRYAAGEISSGEYEERKAKLQQDVPADRP